MTGNPDTTGQVLRYDPDRLADLRQRSVATLDVLRSIRDDDPAAAPAMYAVRVARAHLEEAWLPLVGRILASAR